MVSRTFKMGINLEARAAALFVQNANKFTCRLTISMGNHEANCKSIMGLVSMAILEGSELTITANGENESEALDVMCRMLAEG